MPYRFVLPTLFLALSGCATTGVQETRAEDPGIAVALAGLTPEKPRSCIPLDDTRSTEKFDGTILYRVSARLTYRADIPGCYGLRRDPILVVDVHGSSLCRGDLVRLVDRGTSGFTSGACVFGDFVPYRRPR